MNSSTLVVRFARSVREILTDPLYDPDLPRLSGYPFGTTRSGRTPGGRRS